MYQVGEKARIQPRINGIAHSFKSYTEVEVKDVLRTSYDTYYTCQANGKIQTLTENELAPINQENIKFS
jgi:hypothetical protein